MVDNPKKFLLFVAIAILILVGLVAFFRLVPFKIIPKEQPQTNEQATTSETTSGNTATKNKAATQTNTASNRTPSPSVYDVVVNYTDSGFVPKTIEVKAGISVRFINKSSQAMYVITSSGLNGPIYPDFGQSASVGKGGYFDFTFTKKGTWPYENLNDKTKTGIVIVK